MAKTQSESNMEDPAEVFAWMFTAGVPDPRDGGEGKFRNQPLIPPACFSALSKMLWDFGCRFHPDLQTKWIKPSDGAFRNFEVWETVGVKPPEVMPQVAAMAADQYPEMAAAIADMDPADHEAALREVEDKLLSGLSRLMKAREQMEKSGD